MKGLSITSLLAERIKPKSVKREEKRGEGENGEEKNPRKVGLCIYTLSKGLKSVPYPASNRGIETLEENVPRRESG